MAILQSIIINGVISTNSYVQKNFRAKIIGRRIFQSILLNNNTLINTNEKNCCYFPIEYRSGNIIYSNKTLKIVVCDVTFCFFDNFDVTALKSSRKPRVAGCARMRENLVQFSSKQENQARIITFVNNQYQNYQVSFIKLLFFLSYYFLNITNCINKRYHSSIASCQHSSDQIRCSAQCCLATALGTKQTL